MRFALYCLFFTLSLHSTEIDSFTKRGPNFRDSLPQLNALMQSYFDQTLKQINKNRTCDEKELEDTFEGLTGGLSWAKIEVAIIESPDIEMQWVSRKESIYRDISSSDAWGIHWVKLGNLLKFQDYYIGTDKIGHFIGVGHLYYRDFETLDEALSFGEMTERTYFGLGPNAIYSFADLSANYAGLLFWRRLTHGKDAYFSCQAGVWKQNSTFSWLDYVTPAWDEGINCNFYKTEEIERSVKANIKALGLSCPIDKSYCPKLIRHYGPIAKYLISPACFL